jgi:lipopolysaccharide biosynthesis glycosyltransferase
MMAENSLMKKRALVVSINDSYVIPLKVLLHTLHHTESLPKQLQICILHGRNLSTLSISDLEIFIHDLGYLPRFLDVSSVVPADLPITPSDHVSQETFYRLFSIGLLPPSIEQAVYLDADMVAIRDISALFSLEMTHPLAAADHLSPSEQQRLHGSTGGTYFQAGVLVLNIPQMRSLNSEQRFLCVLKNERIRIRWWDQDVLNIVFQDNWQRLPIWYNVTEAVLHYQEDMEVKSNARLIHFAGSVKPWTSDRFHPFQSAWDEAYCQVIKQKYPRRREGQSLMRKIFERIINRAGNKRMIQSGR